MRIWPLTRRRRRTNLARVGETIRSLHFDHLFYPMQLTIEIIPDLEKGGFTARFPDIPAYGEGETEDEAIADL